MRVLFLAIIVLMTLLGILYSSPSATISGRSVSSKEFHYLQVEELKENLSALTREYREVESEYLNELDPYDLGTLFASRRAFIQANLDIVIEMEALRTYIAVQQDALAKGEVMSAAQRVQEVNEIFEAIENRYSGK